MTGLAGSETPEFRRPQGGEPWQLASRVPGNHECDHAREAKSGSMRRKLMIVDDQVGMTRVVAMAASQLGLEVKVLNNPLHAVDSFLEFRPDILILDMIMPEKDGIDVLHEILLTGVETRIVLTSGLSESYLRLAEGVAHFHDVHDIAILRKPFRRHDLLNVLQWEPSALAAE
jgi:CheY-like chemotaxis protein